MGLLVGTGIVYWSKPALSGGLKKRSTVRWVLRPSNVMFVLAASVFIYRDVLQHPSYKVFYENNSRIYWAITSLFLWMGYVFRRWENEALKKADEVGEDEEQHKNR
jgi:hypothetical protein